jgi:hypothetical protein
MLPALAHPWFIDGELAGFWLLVKTFPNGAKRYRYKKIQGLVREDFITFCEGCNECKAGE